MLADGTELIGHVPQFGPAAYLHLLFPGLDDAELGALAAAVGGDATGRAMHADLLELYSRYNGLSLFSGSLSLYGLNTGLSMRKGDATWKPFSIETPNKHERIKNAPPELVFFGNYDWDGSLVYVSPKSPRVIRCARYSAEPLNEWPSVGEFLVSETRRIGRLFGVNGTQLDENIATTP